MQLNLFNHTKHPDCELRRNLFTFASNKGSVSCGFDIEWRVVFGQGGNGRKTSLLQLCPSSEVCYLFHLSCMNGECHRLNIISFRIMPRANRKLACYSGFLESISF